MKHKKAKLIVLNFFVLGIIGLQAQETVLTTGGDATSSGGTVSYSVGQVVYTTNTGTNGSAAQGVQQPYEISIVLGLKEAIGINLCLTAYPNPTTDFLNLKVENYKTENLTYQLFDSSGKLLEHEKVEGMETILSMENLGHATYFLKVTNNNKEVKTFKIIKN